MSHDSSNKEGEPADAIGARLFDGEEYKTQISLVKRDIQNDLFYCYRIAQHYQNNSIFPLLVRSLRQSDDYKKALEGQRGEPYASVAADLGDVFAFNEKSTFPWWFMHGNKAFGEFGEFNKVEVFTGKEVPKSPAFMTNILVNVPLSLKRKDAIKQFAELFDREQARAKAASQVTEQPIRELYPDQRLRKETIKKMLDVWEKHKADPSMPWWKIGEELNISPELNTNELDDDEAIKHKNRIMTLTVQRLYRMAGRLIDFAAQGDFPRVK